MSKQIVKKRAKKRNQQYTGFGSLVPEGLPIDREAPPVLLGVDPGGRTSGCVLLVNGTYFDHKLFTRGRDEPQEAYAASVCVGIADWVGGLIGPYGDGRVARIETVVPPVGGIRFLRPKDLISVSMVAGAIGQALIGQGWEVGWVRPGGHGKTPDLPVGRVLDELMGQKYPKELLPERKGSAYKDKRRHLRSAWDIAHATPITV